MKWKALLATAVATALALVLSGCGEVRGQIVAKRYQPAYTTVLFVCSKTCIPITTYHPECWQVTVDTGGTACLTQDLWNALPVGSYYDSTKAAQ